MLMIQIHKETGKSTILEITMAIYFGVFGWLRTSLYLLYAFISIIGKTQTSETHKTLPSTKNYPATTK